MEHLDTVIVGGGQAGLATSYYLTQYGREHVVLEQAAQAANAWRNGRWDSFTLVTPNWSLQMPGAEYDGADRDGFMPRAEVVAYFEQYAERFRLPVQYNTRVVAVEPNDHRGYRVQTTERAFRADHVVMATGVYQQPKIPAFASRFAPGITQLHTGTYRNPQALPPGAVLVVGSGQSGTQIAEELHRNGRRVFLSIGSTGRVPRRYRGKDIVEWLSLTGFFDLTPDKLPVPRQQMRVPHLSGTQGGHSLNLHQFEREGVTLLGHLRGAEGDKALLAPDMHENLAKADASEKNTLNMVDRYIESNQIDAPPEELPQWRDGYAQPLREELDLRAAGIQTIIWTMGFTYDFSLVRLPIGDADGYPIQASGVTPHAGLYFVGMPWMPSMSVGMLAGVGKAARHVASHIAEANGRH